jgi:dsDNA-specific endonuclease/ATPase MutS2
MAFDSASLEDAMRQKRHEDKRPLRQPVKHHEPKRDEPLVVDLHIGELLDTTRGMSNAEILNYQIDAFRKVMDANLRNVGKKIVFIHGKGEGVLRQALMKELNYRYKGHDVQDASFREYGYGATQVTIRHHNK